MPTILTALINIKKYGNNDFSRIVPITNENQPRVNKVGDYLDTFVKDALCNSISITDPKKKREIYLSSLSHLGSQNNPPDIMIRGGDAIEVKKVEGVRPSIIPLNSSMPKQKLLSQDPMITEKCKNCEDWDEKDFVYAVGNVVNNKLRVLMLVDGTCYASKKDTYGKVRTSMVEGIKKIGLTLSETKELGRINQIDPLKITSLRIRGMWQINSPLSVFSSILKLDLSKNLCVYTIVSEKKYQKFPTEERKIVEKQFDVSKIKLDDPNNTNGKIDARLIYFFI